MSKENVRLFYEAFAKDKTLQKIFEVVAKKHEGQKPDEMKMDSIYQNEVIPLAKTSGFDFTLAELKNYCKEISKSKTGDLTDKELEAVAGGGGTCVCVIGGYGEDSKTHQTTVVCAMVGDTLGCCFCFFGGGGSF